MRMTMVHMPSTSACFLAAMQVHSHRSTSELGSGTDTSVAWDFFLSQKPAYAQFVCTIAYACTILKGNQKIAAFGLELHFPLATLDADRTEVL